MSKRRTYHVIGGMSGSSLDGLDLARCRFDLADDGRTIADWAILDGHTLDFPEDILQRLRRVTELDGAALFRLDRDLGAFIGQSVHERYGQTRNDLFGSHGHTVFHDPKGGFTTQIGDGATIAARCGLPTVTQFRGADVAAGGQGAPLAPLADVHLLKDYRAFLNLGGIANFSYRTTDGDLIAGDVSGCGQILDRLAGQLGQPYDEGGKLAESGGIDDDLMQRIAAWPYHALPYPKSLDNTEVSRDLYAVVNDETVALRNRLATYTEFLARQTVADLSTSGPVLVTGGGAYNDHLLRRFNALANGRLRFDRAPAATVEFKEAALIALTALFRLLGIPNSLAAATGAERDTINGALYLPQA